jgi:hypothetical protein
MPVRRRIHKNPTFPAFDVIIVKAPMHAFRGRLARLLDALGARWAAEVDCNHRNQYRKDAGNRWGE